MANGYYHADTENGDHMDDPSEDGLFMLIDDLCHPHNTFVIIEPDDGSSDWFASVTLQRNGLYGLEWRDMSRRDHKLTVETNRGQIARKLILWLSGRHYAGKPVRNSG